MFNAYLKQGKRGDGTAKDSDHIFLALFRARMTNIELSRTTCMPAGQVRRSEVEQRSDCCFYMRSHNKNKLSTFSFNCHFSLL